MHGGLQVWKLGLGTSKRALPEVKEQMRGLGSKGVDLGGRESGTKPEHFGVRRWGRREIGPGSRLGRRETNRSTVSPGDLVYVLCAVYC